MNDEWVRLPERWSKFLLAQPETGMDYQVVDLALKDGRKIQDVAIVGASIIAEIKDLGAVRDLAALPSRPEDITGITVTHRKWKCRH